MGIRSFLGSLKRGTTSGLSRVVGRGWRSKTSTTFSRPTATDDLMTSFIGSEESSDFRCSLPLGCTTPILAFQRTLDGQLSVLTTCSWAGRCVALSSSEPAPDTTTYPSGSTTL